jgi:imidazolonepropionase-like amidohydrolase
VIAFRGATVIDGTGSPPFPNALFVISEDRILSVGPATPEAVKALPEGSQVITADGKWIIPGLIDAHVHAESDDDLKTMLNWGVTTVRLMAEDVAAAEKLARESMGRRDIPDVFPAAPIFTARGGWWDQGEPSDRNVDRFPATPAKARAAVRKARALGAREIKIMWDDMGWCRDPKSRLPKIDPRVAQALIDEARRQGLRATVHAPNLADARAAVAAGATALAHGVIEPVDDAMIAMMRKRNVFYIPTMGVFEFLADTRKFVDYVLWKGGVQLPHGARDSLNEASYGFLKPTTVNRYRSSVYSDTYRERYPNFADLKGRLAALRSNLKALHDAGVPIALGTDMWAFPGLGVSIEMELYVSDPIDLSSEERLKTTLSPLDAIQAATHTAARSLGIEKDRGTLEPGKRADFLVLRESPLNLANVRNIDGTWKAGVRVGPMSRQRGP